MEHLKYEYSKTITRSLVLFWVYPSTLKNNPRQRNMIKVRIPVLSEVCQGLLEAAGHTNLSFSSTSSCSSRIKRIARLWLQMIQSYLISLWSALVWFFNSRYCQKTLPAIVREKKPQSMLGYKRVWIEMSEKQGEFSVICHSFSK